MTEPLPRQNEAVAARTIEGSAYLVDPRTSAFYQLNPVATRIWELCDGETTVEGIAEALTGEFEVDLETARQDTATMVEKFVKMGLLLCEDGSGGGAGQAFED